MFQTKNKLIENNIAENLRKEQEVKKLEDDLKREEFENIKPLCLTCINAFVYRYIDNPYKKDPLFVRCKLPHLPTEFCMPECTHNNWQRKCISCSEYKPKTK